MKTMKLIGIILMLAVGNLKAQILNPGFENLNTDGSIQYWGIMYIMSAWVDTSGVIHMDSVVVDQSYCATTLDAHTGLRAVEMRNAFNYTKNEAMSGGAFSSSDTTFSTYSAFSPTSSRPNSMSFFYKFFPVNEDTASAWIELYDASMQVLGSGSIYFSDSVTNYTLANVPISYTSTDSVFLMAIHFNASSRGKNAQFGTLFIVDDVSLASPSGVKDTKDNNNLSVYPNPTPAYLSIHSDLSMSSISMISMDGKTVYSHQGAVNLINCSGFPEGIYMLKVETSKGVSTGKVSVKH